MGESCLPAVAIASAAASLGRLESRTFPAAGTVMDEYEKYTFDLRGYLVVRNALTPRQVQSLSDRLEVERARPGPGGDNTNASKGYNFGSDRLEYPSDDAAAWSAPSLLEWGGPYLDLINLPSIAPYLETLLGKNYRLDHDYLKIHDAAQPGKLYLHGGGQGAGGGTDMDQVGGGTDGGQCYYRFANGKFYNGLVAVAFELNDVAEGEGGFACVAGSHKVNFGLPDAWRISQTQADIPPIVDRVAARAGDAIIFTEACAHGTVPWQGAGERRTIFYKYTPHAVAWSPCYYNADLYEGLTEAQIEMLQPPSSFGPHPHTRPIWARAQAEHAELLALRAELAAIQRGK